MYCNLFKTFGWIFRRYCKGHHFYWNNTKFKSKTSLQDKNLFATNVIFNWSFPTSFSVSGNSLEYLIGISPEIMAYGYHRGINECYASTSSESPQIKEEHELEEHAAFQLHKAVVWHGFLPAFSASKCLQNSSIIQNIYETTNFLWTKSYPELGWYYRNLSRFLFSQGIVVPCMEDNAICGYAAWWM